MAEKYRRILRSWHDEDGGVSFYITRHDEGAGDVYRLENLFGDQWARVGTEEEAKAKASELLAKVRHRCADRCRDWEKV